MSTRLGVICALAVACVGGDAGTKTTSTPTSTVPSSPPTTPFVPSTTIPVPEVCERDPGYAEWPGGRAMRLDAGPFEAGTQVSLTATGAVPGDRVVFHVGRICALDCPTVLDGACFQPVTPLVLGERIADAAGLASLSVVASDWTPEDWFAVQATAPDAAAPYLSQVLVDRQPDANLYQEAWVIRAAPGTYRNQTNAYWSWSLAAGRRTRVVFDPLYSAWYGRFEIIAEGEGSSSREILPGTYLTDTLGPTGFMVEANFYDTFGGNYHLDISTEPLGSPAPWYPDADGDGYGDPAGVPVLSDVPVAGASADPRDCDDTHPARHPWADDRCGDDEDFDCDGVDRPCTWDRASDWDSEISGTRLVGESWSYSGGALAVGDFDADGVADLVSTGMPGWIRPADGDDHGSGGVSLVLDTQQIAVGDLTGDGIDDLVAITSDVQLFRGPIVDPLGEALVLVGQDRTSGLAVGDTTGDGIDDLLTANADGTCRIYTAPDFVTSSEVACGPYNPFERAALADADGDGIDDLWTSELCVYLSPLPTIGAAPDGCVDGHLTNAVITTGDADRDGVLDVAIADDGEVRVYRGPIRGTLDLTDAWATLAASGDRTPAAAPVAFLSRPDDTELVARVYQTYADDSLWIGSVGGGGTLDVQSGPRILRPYGGMIAADLDGDEFDDLVVAEPDGAFVDAPNAGPVWILWGAD